MKNPFLCSSKLLLASVIIAAKQRYLSLCVHVTQDKKVTDSCASRTFFRIGRTSLEIMLNVIYRLMVILPLADALVVPDESRMKNIALQKTSHVMQDLSVSPLPPLASTPRYHRRNSHSKNSEKIALDTSGTRRCETSVPNSIPNLSDILKNDAIIEPARTKKCLPKPSENQKYWKASYHRSRESQKLIQNAAMIDGLPIDKASRVLETFLSLSPSKVNSANIVCAITLSAKLICRETNQKFRNLLYETTDVLALMLEEDLLSARQLCNVAWALAKHFDRDGELLPSTPMSFVDQYEMWDLCDDLIDSPSQRLNNLIDEIAFQLGNILERDPYGAKVGELCMASWAFGILRKRIRPPGWLHTPKYRKLSRCNPSGLESSPNLITFEKTNSNGNSATVSEPDQQRFSGNLLFKIGLSLSQPLSVDVDCHLRMRSCTWSELANLIWAFQSHGGKVVHSSETFLLTAAREATRRLTENGPEAKQALSRDISQIIYSLGTLLPDNFRLEAGFIPFVKAVSQYARVNTVGENGARPFLHWSCVDIAQTILSLAHSRVDELYLLENLCREASFRMPSLDRHGHASEKSHESFDFREINTLLWALARMNLKDGVFNVFGTKAIRSINAALDGSHSLEEIGLGRQEQANICWSLTVLQLYDEEAKKLLSQIFSDFSSSCRESGIVQIQQAHQLWQSLFLLNDEFPGCIENVPRWFYDFLSERWKEEKSRTKISSARHQSLSKTLSLMGVAHYNEHDEDIDVAIILKPQASWTHETIDSKSIEGMKVAVEFDGPYHFTRQYDGAGPPRALGHTVLKYRLLKSQGWTVVRIPFYEYDKIPFWASMERQRYIQRLLKTHGNIQFSDVDTSNYKAPVSNRSSRFD